MDRAASPLKDVKNKVHINVRYQSATRLDANSISAEHSVNAFILHGTAINFLDVLSKDFANSAQRAFTVTGAYGSGKSTAALFLSYLLSNEEEERAISSAKLKHDALSKPEFYDRFNIENGWRVIRHVCGLEAPAQGMLKSIQLACKVKPKKDQTLWDDEQCLSAIESELNACAEKNDGVILLLDELGKALDFQARNGKDLHFFQSLAELAQTSNHNILIVGFLHQSFSDYAKDKDAVTQREWGKVQGRFRDIGYNPSIDETLLLIGDSIVVDAAIQKALLVSHSKLLNAVIHHFPKQARNRELIENALPLDPMVSLLLGPISRRRFSQNERSLFGFLASHEKFGFREFLADQFDESHLNSTLYSPDVLWEYLYHNLHHVIATSPDSKAWLEALDAVHRASQKGTALHISITCLVALMTVFGMQNHLYATREFITDYFLSKGYSPEDISQAISDLEAWTVVIFRRNHNAIFVFQGSDIDINQLLLEKVEAISAGVDWTAVCGEDHHIMATAHYHEKGSMRWANARLLNNFSQLTKAELERVPKSGQHFLDLVIVVEHDSVPESLYTHPYFAVGQPQDLSSLKSVALELIAMEQVSREEKKIQHDLIAKNELETRIEQAKQRLASELEVVFQQATWLYNGEEKAQLPLASIVSEIADEVFNRSPKVLNELVNRSKPSGSANAAINKLLVAMLNHGDKENLGFDSETFPPEKGIYLSCLKSKGWHGDSDQGFVFSSVWPEEERSRNLQMYELWKSGRDFIKDSDCMVTMQELYDYWMQPPFGLTSGLCRIYGMALLKSLDGQLALYDYDSSNQFIFIPQLDEVLVNKLHRYPKEVGFRYFAMSEIQAQLIQTLATATIEGRQQDKSILGIARHIVQIVRKLPNWVQKTSGDSFVDGSAKAGLTQKARNFRNEVLRANDPFKLILEDLPRVFDIDLSAENSKSVLASRLKKAIEDLTAQHNTLMKGFSQLIQNGLGAAFNDELLSRCNMVAENAQRPEVKDFAKRLAEFVSGKCQLEHVVSTATEKPSKSWTDAEIRLALDELPNLCVQFRRIESFSKVSGDKSSMPICLQTRNLEGDFVEKEAFVPLSEIQNPELMQLEKLIKSNMAKSSTEARKAVLTKLLLDELE